MSFEVCLIRYITVCLFWLRYNSNFTISTASIILWMNLVRVTQVEIRWLCASAGFFMCFFSKLVACSSSYKINVYFQKGLEMPTSSYSLPTLSELWRPLRRRPLDTRRHIICCQYCLSDKTPVSNIAYINSNTSILQQLVKMSNSSNKIVFLLSLVLLSIEISGSSIIQLTE